MSEQQRIFVAVAACLAIMLLWPFITGRKSEAPKTTTPVAASTKAPPTTPGVQKPSPEVAPPTEPAAVPPLEPTPAESETSPIENVKEERREFATPLVRGAISNKPLSLTRLELLHYDERVTEDGNGKKTEREPVSLVTAKEGDRFEQAAIEWTLGKRAAPPLEWVKADSNLTLRGFGANNVDTEVRITPRTDVYALDYVLALKNGSTEALPVGATVALALGISEEKKSGWFGPPPNLLNGMCAVAGKVERHPDKKVKEDGPITASGPAQWAGIDRQYFVVAMLPGASSLGTCVMRVEEKNLIVDYSFPEETVAAGASWERRFTIYLGPKRNESLEAVSPALTEVIDYSIWGIPLGFLARPMVFLLNVFHGWTSSWGVAIMLLTLVVKLLLFPVTYKSSISMRKMQLLKPELDRLKKQFDGDREKQQMEQMRLFKEKGVNPLGGCLPMLLQMPVWFALYRTLWTAVDLYQEPFLWLPDLTAKEPFPFMALALGGLTFLQQKLMPTATDSQQAKMMMYFMPVMLTVFMIALPSGLVLYILFNSVLTILQQLVINKRTPKLV